MEHTLDFDDIEELLEQLETTLPDFGLKFTEEDRDATKYRYKIVEPVKEYPRCKISIATMIEAIREESLNSRNMGVVLKEMNDSDPEFIDKLGKFLLKCKKERL
jgi:hypothetical protein